METTRVISHFNSGAANNSCTFFIYGSSTARPPTQRGRSRFTPADLATLLQVIKACCDAERPQPLPRPALHTCRTSDFSSVSRENEKKVQFRFVIYISKAEALMQAWNPPMVWQITLLNIVVGVVPQLLPLEYLACACLHNNCVVPETSCEPM